MKKGIRAALSALVIGAMVAAGVMFLGEATKRDASDFKYRPFFEDDTTYDVLFFGTSHMMNAVYPMELWREYGITSYNFGGNANSLAISYWLAVSAFDVHKPKVAVLDVLYAGAQTPGMDVGVAHQSMDVWPLSLTKIKAVREIFPDSEGDRMEMLFPFSVYHNRWNELTAQDWGRALGGEADCTREKGAEMRIAVCEPWETALVAQDAYYKEDSVGLDYIARFIELCEANGVQPVIVNIPFPASEEHQLWANAAIRLAQEKGVPALNMQYTGAVDFDTDCYDAGSHLNPSGARKVTHALGEFLTVQFGLADKRGDGAFAGWHEDCAAYDDLKMEQLGEHDDLRETLMLLYASGFTAELETTAAYVPDDVERKLIDQLGEGIARSEAETIATPGGAEADIRLTIRDGDGGEIVTRYYDVGSEITPIAQ